MLTVPCIVTEASSLNLGPFGMGTCTSDKSESRDGKVLIGVPSMSILSWSMTSISILRPLLSLYKTLTTTILLVMGSLAG